MNRAGFATLLCALPIACREAPVLGADVEDAALASPSASTAPSALATRSALPASPLLNRQVISAFPACLVQQPSDPNAKLRSAGDEMFGARELHVRFDACLQRSLHEPAQVNIAVGILPSGGICDVRVDSSLTLSTECIACFTRALRGYRFSAADTGSGVMIPIAFRPTRSAK
jgi:hypothetical protein